MSKNKFETYEIKAAVSGKKDSDGNEINSHIVLATIKLNPCTYLAEKEEVPAVAKASYLKGISGVQVIGCYDDEDEAEDECEDYSHTLKKVKYGSTDFPKFVRVYGPIEPTIKLEHTDEYPCKPRVIGTCTDGSIHKPVFEITHSVFGEWLTFTGVKQEYTLVLLYLGERGKSVRASIIVATTFTRVDDCSHPAYQLYMFGEKILSHLPSVFLNGYIKSGYFRISKVETPDIPDIPDFLHSNKTRSDGHKFYDERLNKLMNNRYDKEIYEEDFPAYTRILDTTIAELVGGEKQLEE